MQQLPVIDARSPTPPPHPEAGVWTALHERLDALLYGLSTHAVPLLLVVLSAIALFYWNDQYLAPSARELSFRVLPESAQAALTPAQAVERLRDRPSVGFADSRLATTPIWIAVPIDGTVPFASSLVDFPSRHSQRLTCWNAATLQWLGEATPAATSGAMARVKAGFAMDLAKVDTLPELLCRIASVGPARIKVLLWPTAEMTVSSQQFHRNSGLLDGGLVMLALFVLITALINRNRVYVLFAAWLLVNLRMGAVSAGWDIHWFGHLVPADWLLRMRLLTLSIYYLLTVMLFRALFRDDLQQVGHPALMRFVLWSCPPLLVASAILPFALFLQCIWAVTALSVSVFVFLLGRILLRTRSRVAMWYAASMALTLSASLYEVLSAAFGVRGLIGAVNSVTGALSSSLLASLAIAEHMRLEHGQRLQAQAELEHTYEAMPIGLFTLDRDGCFTSANPALRRMLGQDVLEPGRDAWQRYFEDGSWAQLQALVQTQGSAELEVRGRAPADPRRPGRYLVKAARGQDRIEGSLQDVTEKSLAAEELHFMANHDSLTKVLNRRGIERALQCQLADAADRGADQPLALAYLDLDRFKLINDLFGHNAGDEVLRQVCARIDSMLAEGMRVGRMGGDEFLIVMPATRMAAATQFCRRLLSEIGGTSYRVADKAFHVRASVGLIEVSPDSAIKDVVSVADRACREAKAGRSGGLVVYEKSTRARREHEHEMRLVERLSGSNPTEGLFLEMQPIMSMTAPHASLDFEVLLRMRDADGRLVPTSRVIAAAENGGFMSVIDRWVLSSTLAWLERHVAQLAKVRFVCLNLSGASLNDEQFMRDIYTVLHQNTHLAGRLCFEITESVALRDLENTRRFIDTVRGYGARVALDDFGAGYTSFSYLKELPADLLKIDGSFIARMNEHPANVAIVEAIVNLGRQLGMKTLAEWAEDGATVRTLAAIGVDYVQGYAIARPQALGRLLAATSSASFVEDPQTMRYIDELQRRAEGAGRDRVRGEPVGT